jgi:ribosomal protein S18 acetylase RimI-like enzyme
MHQQCLPGSFLSCLGTAFLTRLYGCICAYKGGVLLVAVDSDNRIAGFISAADNTTQLYRFFLARHWLCAMIHLPPRILRLPTMVRVWETVSYGFKRNERVPKAELLSLAVAPQSRQHRTGSALFHGLVAAFGQMNIGSFVVTVGGHLEPANAFYRSLGCRVVSQTVVHHGQTSNVYAYPGETASG